MVEFGLMTHSFVTSAMFYPLFYHLVLSTITFIVCGITAFLAFLWAWVDRRVRRVAYASGRLPPLMPLEVFLFRAIGVSFILLTLLLGVSLLTFPASILVSTPRWWLKSVLVLMVWVIFGVLLWGRYSWGWRGRFTIYATLTGVLLFAIIVIVSLWMWEG